MKKFLTHFTALMVLTASLAVGDEDPLVVARAFVEELDVRAPIIDTGIKQATWNDDKTAVAVCFDADGGTICLLAVKADPKNWKLIDVSKVERANLGKLGFGRDHYDKVRTTAKKWRGKGDDWPGPPDTVHQIRMITQAWNDGQRYTVGEDLILSEDLEPLWR